MLLDLKKSCFNNLVDFWKSIANTEAATCVDTNDYICISTGITAPLFNPVFLKETAKELPIFAVSSSHSIWHDSDRNSTIELKSIPKLEVIMERVPMMSIHLDRVFKQEFPPEVTINIVENGSDLKDWIMPVQAAFEMDENTTLRYRHGLENSTTKFVHFVARKENKTIASASLFLHHVIAGLYNLSVLPEYRKQGIATALHYARLNEAKKRGYDYATLQATPMASSLDDSLGFVTLSELTIFNN